MRRSLRQMKFVNEARPVNSFLKTKDGVLKVLAVKVKRTNSTQDQHRDNENDEPAAKRMKVGHNSFDVKKPGAFLNESVRHIRFKNDVDNSATPSGGANKRSKSKKVVWTTVRSTSVSTRTKTHQPESTGVNLDNDNLEIYKENVNEPSVSELDAEQNESFSYLKMRELNVKANEDFFASLGMNKVKEELQLFGAKKKTLPSQRGLKMNKKPQEPQPHRYSLRIKRIDPLGKPLPELEPILESVEESRLPPGPVAMKECAYSKSDEISHEYVKSTCSLICCQKSEVSLMSTNTVFRSALEKITITESRVAKVVPGRVSSICWHPSCNSLICVAGDKYGHIGLWDITASETTSDQAIVRAFRPHIKAVSDLFIPPADSHKLYSCSYDSSLRCGNFEREVFDEVFSVPEQNDDIFRNFSFIDSTNTMLVSQFSGNVSLVDTRTPTTSAEQVYSVSKKSLRTVSVHPTQPHYFITAGVDTTIALWDLRSISQKSPKPVQKLEHHTKAISSAYFSPTGHKVLSCAADDTIMIYSVDDGMKLHLFKQVRHNNYTGRWLNKFQPNWHPAVKDVFVSGSMHRPRQIEVFSADGNLLKALTDENYLGSVCSLNVFHPNKTCTLVGANSSGRLHVFM